MKKDMPLFLFRLIQFTWGLPQSAAGLLLFLFFYKYKHFPYRNAIITAWSDGADCVSLGPFIFVSGSFLPKGDPSDPVAADADHRILTESETPPAEQAVIRSGIRMTPALERILRHEYGHSIQSLVLGPLYLFVVGLPSILWCRVPALGKSWRSGRRSYYSFITERSADRLGGNERSRDPKT